MNIKEQAALEKALYGMRDPCLNVPLADYVLSARFLRQGKNLHVQVPWPYPAASLLDQLKANIKTALSACVDAEEITVQIDWDVPRLSTSPASSPLAEVRNLVPVASGKGGVGKSVTSVNLAFALQAEGARVGLLDADIYGPSQRQMLGLPEDLQLKVQQEKLFEPVKAHGLTSMSMSYLVGKKTPLVWRGPMASSALEQMLKQTVWGALDYLIVDMPPGTGDIQLTLSQKASVAAALIVTTPQDVALLDARRAIEMFAKVKIPVLGLIENMSSYVCPQCGDKAALFGEGGAARTASEYGLPLLGQLPLDVAIRTGTDSGAAPTLVDPDGDLAASYRSLARHAAAHLALRAAKQQQLSPVQIR